MNSKLRIVMSTVLLSRPTLLITVALATLLASIPVSGQTCAGLDSHFVTLDIPPSMVAGETYRLAISVRNVGTRIWQDVPGDETRLGSTGIHYNAWSWRRSTLPSGAVVRPGEAVVFEPIVTAPSTPGAYQFQARMLNEGVCGFGPLSPLRNIQVRPAVARTSDRLVVADFVAHFPFDARKEIWFNCSDLPQGFSIPVFLANQSLVDDWISDGALALGLEPIALENGALTQSGYDRLVWHYRFHLWRAGQIGIDALIITLYPVDTPQRLYNFTVSVRALFEARDELRSEHRAAPAIAFLGDGIEFWDRQRADGERYTADSDDLDQEVWPTIEATWEIIETELGGFDPLELLQIESPVTPGEARIPLFINMPMAVWCEDADGSERPCEPGEPHETLVADDYMVSRITELFSSVFGVELAVIPAATWFSSGWGGNNLSVKNAPSYFIWGASNHDLGAEPVQRYIVPRDPAAAAGIWFGFTSVGPGFESASCVPGQPRDVNSWYADLEDAWAEDAWPEKEWWDASLFAGVVFGNWIKIETLDLWWEGSQIMCDQDNGCDYFFGVKNVLGERQY